MLLRNIGCRLASILHLARQQTGPLCATGSKNDPKPGKNGNRGRPLFPKSHLTRVNLLAHGQRTREGRGVDDGAGGAARARRWCATAPRFNNCVEGALALTCLLMVNARARGAAPMMVLAARRELGGGVRQHPGSTTALRGLHRNLPAPPATDRPTGRRRQQPDRQSRSHAGAFRHCVEHTGAFVAVPILKGTGPRRTSVA